MTGSSRSMRNTTFPCSACSPTGGPNIGRPTTRHEYELYLAVEDIDHTRTKAKSPQTNGIVERFHKTMLDEFYRIAFRKRIYATIEDLQADLDLWMREFNAVRPHQGANGALERRRSTPSLTPSRWRKKNAFRSPTAINPPPHDQKRPAYAVRQIKYKLLHRGDPRHECVTVVHTLSAAEPQGKGTGFCEILRIGGSELLIVSHAANDSPAKRTEQERKAPP